MNRVRKVESIVTYFGKGVTPKYVNQSQIIVLNQKCIRNNFIDYSLSRFIDDKKDYSESKFLKKGDVLINSTGVGTAGRVAFVNSTPKGKQVIVDSHILVLRTANYYESACLNYMLFSREGLLQSFIDGSTGQGEFDRVKLFNIEVGFPGDQTQQQKIVATLSIIDDKIELNRKINAELEQMSRTLYDYWFVQFDFPDTSGKPYKSCGGAMKSSPELNREIPASWSYEKLDKIISRSGTGLNPRKNFKLGLGNNYYVTIKNVENGKIVLDDKCDKIDDEALKIIQKRSDLQVGDILFTSIQPVGVTYLIHERPMDWNINESVFTIRPNYEKVTSEFLYMLLSSQEMKFYTTNSSAGSIHKGIRHAVLKDFNATLAPKEIIDEYTKIVSPILKKLNQNDQESQKLAHLRDWLLPMLMNGQVKVGNG